MSVGMIVVIIVGYFVITTVNQEIAKEIPLVDGSGSTALASSLYGISGKASGEMTKLSSVGDEWMVNFKDDLSDYKFTGVDATELYFLQYAFENHDSVTVTYTVENDVKTLEGVTLSSPAPPPATETAKKNDEFNYWLFLPMMVGPIISMGFLYSQHRHRRRVDRMIQSFESRTVTIEDQVAGESSSNKKKEKKKEEEPVVEVVLPLDGRYRVERAETLLGEKDKNRKYRKKKKEK